MSSNNWFYSIRSNSRSELEWLYTALAVIGPTLSSNVWTHIITSYSITNGVRLWINGAMIGSTGPFAYVASGAPHIITLGTSFSWYPNCMSSSISIEQFYGAIDELRIYARELTATDIYSLANP